jgi:hypothetical protein
MKKTLILIILMSTFLTLNAQKFFPSPSDNPFWTEIHGGLWTCFYPGCSGYYCSCDMPVYYKSDTTINGTIYNRLYSYGLCSGQYTNGPPPYPCPFMWYYQEPESLFAIIRRDTVNKRVFLFDNGQDQLLYDFNSMVVGQNYPSTCTNDTTYGYGRLVVVSIDSIYCNGFYLMKWGLGHKDSLMNVFDSNFVSVIEGIGSTYGIKTMLMPPFENYDGLVCFSLNNIVLYPDSSFNCDIALNSLQYEPKNLFEIFPNPASDRISILVTNDGINGVLTISNINGQVLKEQSILTEHVIVDISNLSKGVYFVRLKSEHISEIKMIIIE